MRPYIFENRLQIFWNIKIWHITSIQNIVNSLKELFWNNLIITEQEHSILLLNTSTFQQISQIFIERLGVIGFCDLNLEW